MTRVMKLCAAAVMVTAGMCRVVGGAYGASNLPTPAIRLAADVGVSTDESGNVTKWANQGSIGSSLDVAPDVAWAAANAGGITVSTSAGFNGQPAIIFDRTKKNMLISSGTSDSGVTTAGGAWFCVYKPNSYEANDGLFSLSDTTSKRLGALMNNNCIYSYFFGAAGSELQISYYLGEAQCLCHTRFNKTSGAASEVGFVRGTGTVKSGSSAMTCPPAAYLKIGGRFMDWKHTGTEDYYIFDGAIAEVRFYNQPLTALERAAIEFELSAKYGLAYYGYGLNGMAVPDGCSQDITGCGNASNEGVAPATVATTCTSGGATVSFGTTPEDGTASVILLAHNDAAGTERRWFLAGEEDARAVGITFAVASDYCAGIDDPALLCKGSDGNWTLVAQLPTLANGDYIFTVASNWKSGEYKIGKAGEVLAAKCAIRLVADTGVTTNENGYVTKWENQGTVGSVLDVVPQSGEANAGIMASNGGTAFGGKPTVVFDATDYLKSAEKSTAGLTTAGGAWFLVLHPDSTADNTTIYSLTEDGEGSSHRMGAFFLTPSVLSYFHAATDPKYYLTIPAITGDMLMCHTRYEEGKYERMFIFGKAYGEGHETLNTIKPGAAYLEVGCMNDWANKFDGQIAELRFYNQPLTAAERACVDFELAAKYAIPYAGCGWNSTVLPADCAKDVAAAGDMVHEGVAPATVATTCASGGAKVSFVAAPAADTASLILLANDGAAGTARRWWLGGGSDARASALTFAVPAATYAGLTEPMLHVRVVGSAIWKPVSAGVTSDGMLTFTIPANWSAGEYTVGDGATAFNLTVWLKADEGVSTDANGYVTKWANLGTAGAAFDVAPSSGVANAGITLSAADAFGGKPAIVFNGTDELISADVADTGISSEGCSWFVVYRPNVTTKTEDQNRGFFAFNADGSYRFGAFFVNDNARAFVGSSGGYYREIPRVGQERQCYGVTAYREDTAPKIVGFLRGERAGGEPKANTTSLPPVGRFVVGNMALAFTKYYVGEIAELRFYNRPLTGAERERIDCELSAKYHVENTGVTEATQDDFTTHTTALRVFGYCAGYGAASTMTTAATSGALTLGFETAPDETVNSYTTLGHNGGTAEFAACTDMGRWRECLAQTWVVLSHVAANTAMTFAFDVGGDGEKYEYAICYRTDASAAWQEVTRAATVTDGIVNFTTGWCGNGEYALARRAIPPKRCVIIVR